jgi:hypothetical protein
MSTQPPPSATPAPVTPDDVQIKIVSHSSLFYWWPVWAMGFLLAILTRFDGHLMAVVPGDEEKWKGVYIKTGKDSYEEHEGVVFLPGDDAKALDNKKAPAEVEKPRLHVSRSSTYGVLFATVFLLVIVITNVPLRGLWSFVLIMFLVMLSIIFAFAGWWDAILRTISALAIHINMGGYLFISSVLFIIWLVTFLLFDQQLYMIFTPGQLKVRLEIGGGEKAYDTMGMTIEKQRSDLFRHWVLGLGSGDLIVNTGGSHLQHFDLPNVLFIGRKVKEIEDMLRERAVVKGHA